MAELTSMRNIGKEMARKLAAVGIGTPEQLEQAGAEQAFFRMKVVFPEICLVHLYALEGAIRNVEFNSLSAEQRGDLKAFSDCLKGRRPGGKIYPEEEDHP